MMGIRIKFRKMIAMMSNCFNVGLTVLVTFPNSFIVTGIDDDVCLVNNGILHYLSKIVKDNIEEKILRFLLLSRLVILLISVNVLIDVFFALPYEGCSLLQI